MFNFSKPRENNEKRGIVLHFALHIYLSRQQDSRICCGFLLAVFSSTMWSLKTSMVLSREAEREKHNGASGLGG